MNHARKRFCSYRGGGEKKKRSSERRTGLLFCFSEKDQSQRSKKQRLNGGNRCFLHGQLALSTVEALKPEEVFGFVAV